MFAAPGNTSLIKTTSHKVVLPFYIYAAISFLIATILLFTSHGAFLKHYFHPHILATTHIMALGWGTMIILGASHQLVPVLIEGKLYSGKLAYLSFILAAAGIPLLVYGFYVFNMGTPAKWGGRLVFLSVLMYLINIIGSIAKSNSRNVHAVYALTAAIWLFLVVSLGLVLVYNFTSPFLKNGSVHFLSLHAHAGTIGWFLLIVIGVGSRLIPMFLISKYTNPRLLWLIYYLLNAGLIAYIFIFYTSDEKKMMLIPSGMVLFAILSFIYYCFQAFRQRLRRQVDEQVKISLLSVLMLLIPAAILFIIIMLLISSAEEKANLVLAYGFLIFFGWITAIILGMTFKTLPFIVWNKVYHLRSASGKTPNPKDLFSHSFFNAMCLFYLTGFVLFAFGILFSSVVLLRVGALFLIITAFLYNWNVIKVINHKAPIQ